LIANQNYKTRHLEGRVALVTGASGGIGRAIALGLAHQGAQLCLVGRDEVRLPETVAAVEPISAVKSFQVDLTVKKSLQPLLQYLGRKAGRLDVLVHGAGVICQGVLEKARIEDFDLQYATNLRAPYLLTQRLMPLLKAARGQIVFINSSVALAGKRPEVGQYAATKHGLKAVADSLREEVNSQGIRVLTVFLGRTAIPAQEALHKEEGRPYRPRRLLQAEDVASVVVNALTLPPTAEVTEIAIRPMMKT
jgi:NAD(P)-dependent dehydrogenase (short-subunit alcohol dehydrogenase family)